MTDPFARFSIVMIRWRWVVVAVWFLLIAVAGGVLAPKANEIVKGGGFAVPGSPSDEAAKILDKDFHISTRTSVIAVYHSNPLTIDDPTFKNAVKRGTARMATVHGVVNIVDFYNSGDSTLVSHDRHTMTSRVALKGDASAVAHLVPKLRDQLKGLPIEHFITGRPASDEDTFTISEQDLRRSELFTIPIVVILLLFVFRTVVSAAIPLVLGAASVTVSSALVYALASNVDTSVFALNIASMIGLGLGIDFSLMVVNRLREEIAAGQSTQDAIAMTMATAGRSITYSAITVMLSMALFTILVLNLMIVRSISIAVIFVAFTALLAGLTLLPAVLAILGHRVEWLRVVPRRVNPAGEGGVGFWYRLSHAIMRRPWIWLGVSLLILVVIALPLRDLALIGASPSVLPTSAETVKGFDVTKAAFGEGRLTPIQIVVKTQRKNGIWRRQVLAGLQALTRKAAADPRTQEVDSLVSVARAIHVPSSRFTSVKPQMFTSNPKVAREASQFVNLHGDNNESVVTIFSKYGQYNSAHEQLVYDLHDKLIPSIPQLARRTSYVGGEAAEFLAFRDTLYGRFPFIVAAVLALIFVILLMFFQSIFLPLKAMFMNLATILATYGALVVIFQYSWFPTAIFGFKSEHLLGAMTPAILFAILFGLSTDYEVFMLSRVREFYHKTNSNEEAVATGLQSTAGVITAAGLILIGTFGSFASAQVISIKEIGIGLAIGVLLDTTVVRVIMVPATMRLMGDWNWWMPSWLKKIVPEIREGPAPQPAFAMASVGTSASPVTTDTGPPAGVTQPLPVRQVASVRAPATSVRGMLRPKGGSVGTEVIPLSQRQALRIGRDHSNQLQLFDPQTSRFHASIDYRNGGYSITDQRSTNGVFINGERIAAVTPVQLRAGDVIQIGSNSQLRFAFETMPSDSTVAVSRES